MLLNTSEFIKCILYNFYVSPLMIFFKNLIVTKFTSQIYIRSQKQKKMQQSQSKIQTYSRYYRKAQRNSSWFGKGTFKLRFPQIINSLVDKNIFMTMYGLLRWRLGYANQSLPTDPQKLRQQLPVTRPNFQNNQNQIKYTWIGHSTAVISFGNDANFIIDPVFSDRCSPVQFLGPKRFRPLPCEISELPRIDAVLVSHDHYDHLDSNALAQIHQRFPNAHFFAGLDSGDVFPSRRKMHQMDWTEQRQIQINSKKFKVTFVPVCHWSRRGVFDKNKRLWGGFVVQAPNNKKLFYSGDTGYCGIFQQLGQIFGNFDLCILPIGAYHPRQFLKNQHINPEQAVRIHKQLKSKKSVGVHWGTFPLGFQHYTAARRDLEKAKQKHQLQQQDFLAIGHGQSFSISYL